MRLKCRFIESKNAFIVKLPNLAYVSNQLYRTQMPSFDHHYSSPLHVFTITEHLQEELDRQKICLCAHIYKAQYDCTTDHILQLVYFVD